jgi:hypothetical protein
MARSSRRGAKTSQNQIARLGRVVELKTSDYVPVNVMWTQSQQPSRGPWRATLHLVPSESTVGHLLDCFELAATHLLGIDPASSEGFHLGAPCQTRQALVMSIRTWPSEPPITLNPSPYAISE